MSSGTEIVAERGSSPDVQPRKNNFLYPLLWLLANGLIWSAALGYTLLRPSAYVSRWTINIPGADSSTSLYLPDIGQASLSNDSPYALTSSDPRENYKFLVGSRDVITSAASQVGIPVEQFDQPRVKILDNTTFMQFEIQADTPEAAQQKAFALQRALEQRLDKLRSEEVAQQDLKLETALGFSEDKLRDAQQRLTDYKSQSGLNISEQLRDISRNLEELRRQRAEVLAQMQQAQTKFNQLSTTLALVPQQASEALILQSDPIFQRYLSDYKVADAELAQLQTRYLQVAPPVVAQTQKRDAARTTLLNRGEALLGRPVSETVIEYQNLSGGGESSSSDERAALFQSLITLQVEAQGLEAKAQSLSQQIAQLEQRFAALSRQEPELDGVQRDMRISEAVFSSTLTKLDLSKTTLSTSYPPISVVESPNLPEESSTAQRNLFLLLGAALSSCFLTTGMLALWFRQRRQPTDESDSARRILVRSNSR